MQNSYRFFENRDCKYFPCHEGLEACNCLFCYCPLYRETPCPGNPSYIGGEGRQLKDCSHCSFPHRPESYDVIIGWIRRRARGEEG